MSGYHFKAFKIDLSFLSLSTTIPHFFSDFLVLKSVVKTIYSMKSIKFCQYSSKLLTKNRHNFCLIETKRIVTKFVSFRFLSKNSFRLPALIRNQFRNVDVFPFQTNVMLKILACGDVAGRISAWIKRIEAVEKKAGPFEMVLCVGSFFSSDPDAHEGIPKAEAQAWQDLLAGRRRLPIPCYILGPNRAQEAPHFKDLGGYEICENLVHLGRRGCLTTREGIKVAYLSGGAEGPPGSGHGFHYDDVKALEAQLRWDDVHYAGVDVLLTSQWPKGEHQLNLYSAYRTR